jgi:hypothetical protein
MAPTSDKISWAVAAVMRKCGQPLILADGRAVLAKWQQIRANPRLADIVPPAITWPAVTLAPDPEGKTVLLVMLFCTTIPTFRIISYSGFNSKSSITIWFQHAMRS